MPQGFSDQRPPSTDLSCLLDCHILRARAGSAWEMHISPWLSCTQASISKEVLLVPAFPLASFTGRAVSSFCSGQWQQHQVFEGYRLCPQPSDLPTPLEPQTFLLPRSQEALDIPIMCPGNVLLFLERSTRLGVQRIRFRNLVLESRVPDL